MWGAGFRFLGLVFQNPGLDFEGPCSRDCILFGSRRGDPNCCLKPAKWQFAAVSIPQIGKPSLLEARDVIQAQMSRCVCHTRLT